MRTRRRALNVPAAAFVELMQIGKQAIHGSIAVRRLLRNPFPCLDLGGLADQMHDELAGGLTCYENERPRSPLPIAPERSFEETANTRAGDRGLGPPLVRQPPYCNPRFVPSPRPIGA